MRNQQDLQEKIDQLERRMDHASESKLNHNQFMKLSKEKDKLMNELAQLKQTELEGRVSH
ncbi:MULTISPECIES: hypothetical protein [Oceanobacillus]|uniref:Uncharacterized protein n=1 Tax=Oceanobacillus kimchii TaxID=746691 RepID=A0ABQ5TPW6_9BACI|nr:MULTISPECIES: hypothetical protein [Oceanobacillus]MBT2599953.1 hypothetical protein [Oceanobacillus sp. ISL-74]MBT2652597.1 hypothetical protein [Oceanobacillus sp. ISL-73]OEH56477.1 hypothetical protein AQ616_02870 [Oceanobacillus sp. E9]GLO68175.1 hypothetical protein MACH08_39590 [Oceanobacillus kimchii]